MENASYGEIAREGPGSYSRAVPADITAQNEMVWCAVGWPAYVNVLIEDCTFVNCTWEGGVSSALRS